MIFEGIISLEFQRNIWMSVEFGAYYYYYFIFFFFGCGPKYCAQAVTRVQTLLIRHYSKARCVWWGVCVFRTMSC